MKIHPIKCRQTERLELTRLAQQLERQTDSRTFLRRTAVFFALAVLGLGIWDFAVAQFHPLRSTIIAVGAILSASMLLLMWLHERADQTQVVRASLLRKDADGGEYNRIEITNILGACRVSGLKDSHSGYVLRTETEQLYLGGPVLNDAIDEYHFRQLKSGVEKKLTMASEAVVEQWPHSRHVRVIELSGEMLPTLGTEIPIQKILSHLPNREREAFTTLPNDLVDAKLF